MRPALRPDAVLVQAVIAGALSFAHLHDLAAAAGQSGWKAWAYPISVDLLLVAAWRRLRADGPSRLAWCTCTARHAKTSMTSGSSCTPKPRRGRWPPGTALSPRSSGTGSTRS